MQRTERKTTTKPDGTSEHLEIEQNSNDLTAVLLFPVGLCLSGVACWLILQAGLRVGTEINPPQPITGTSYVVHIHTQ